MGNGKYSDRVSIDDFSCHGITPHSTSTARPNVRSESSFYPTIPFSLAQCWFPIELLLTISFPLEWPSSNALNGVSCSEFVVLNLHHILHKSGTYCTSHTAVMQVKHPISLSSILVTTEVVVEGASFAQEADIDSAYGESDANSTTSLDEDYFCFDPEHGRLYHSGSGKQQDDILVSRQLMKGRLPLPYRSKAVGNRRKNLPSVYWCGAASLASEESDKHP
jgi:hypothetical protein